MIDFKIVANGAKKNKYGVMLLTGDGYCGYMVADGIGSKKKASSVASQFRKRFGAASIENKGRVLRAILKASDISAI